MVISLKNLTTRVCRSCKKEFKTNVAMRKCLQCSTKRTNTSSLATKRLKKQQKPSLKKKKVKSLSKLRKKCEDKAKEVAKKRDKYTCQKCGKVVSGSDCHGSHVRPVSSGNQFRFDIRNIKVLCYHCHINWWHKNPIEAAEWFKEKFPDRYEYLFKTIQLPVKYDESYYINKIKEYDAILAMYD